MSVNYKEVKNGNGTTLIINDETYIKIGKHGKDVWLRANGKLYCFNNINDLVNAIDGEKATYKEENKKC